MASDDEGDMAQLGSDNTSAIETNVSLLHDQIQALGERLNQDRPNYKEFWNHVQEINRLFKTIKPLPAAVRDRLWEAFGETCSKAKTHQAENARNHAKREHISTHKRSLVESKIREAYLYAKGSNSKSDLSGASKLLHEALQWMKNGWSGFTATTELFEMNDGRMTKTDHEACWQKWQEANEMIRCRRKELGDYYFDRYQSDASDAINTADYDPKRAKEKVQTIQTSMRGKIMSGDQFAEVNRLLDKAWKHASEKQHERYEEGQQRHREWESRARSNIHKKQTLIQYTEESIDKLHSQIDHCHELESEARSSSYASEVRGWIDEKRRIISEKRHFIHELEEQIRELESKLRS